MLCIDDDSFVLYRINDDSDHCWPLQSSPASFRPVLAVPEHSWQLQTSPGTSRAVLAASDHAWQLQSSPSSPRAVLAASDHAWQLQSSPGSPNINSIHPRTPPAMGRSVRVEFVCILPHCRRGAGMNRVDVEHECGCSRCGFLVTTIRFRSRCSRMRLLSPQIVHGRDLLLMILSSNEAAVAAVCQRTRLNVERGDAGAAGWLAGGSSWREFQHQYRVADRCLAHTTDTFFSRRRHFLEGFSRINWLKIDPSFECSGAG